MTKVFRNIVLSLLILVLLGAGAFFYLTTVHAKLSPEFEAWYGNVRMPSSDTAICVQFVGVSTMVISDGETSLMTDGFFSRPSAFRLLFGKIEPEKSEIAWGVRQLGIERLDAVIAVHSHFDHAMDSPEVARLTGARLFGSESTANIARGWGLPESQIRVFQDWVPVTIGKFRITPILTRHYRFPNGAVAKAAIQGDQQISTPLVPPVKMLDYRMGEVYGILFEHPQGKFLLQSSAGYEEEGFADLEADVVLLGVAGLAAQTQEYQETYFREVVDRVDASMVIPIHWDAFVGSIRKRIQGPVLLNDHFMDMNGSLEVVRREIQKRENIDVQLLPRWKKVMLFP